MGRKRIRQADVARLAGVSQAAVSAVLNGRVQGDVRVSAATAARIREAMRELGYAANPVARSLAGGRNNLLGVFTYEPVFPVAQHDFYYPFLVGIEEEAAAQQYDLLLHTSNSSEDGTRHIYRDGFSRLRLADGAILLGYMLDPAEIRKLAGEGFPFVSIGRRELADCPIAYVAADYVSATAHVVQRLVDVGHRRLLFVGRNTGLAESAWDRERGYRTACMEYSLQADMRRLAAAEIDAASVARWLSEGITAIIAEDDVLAHAVYAVAAEFGKSPPRDFSLALLGDPTHYRPDVHDPEWTRFLVPREAMGRAAVRLVVSLIESDGHSDLSRFREILPCPYASGTTTGPPPSPVGPT